MCNASVQVSSMRYHDSLCASSEHHLVPAQLLELRERVLRALLDRVVLEAEHAFALTAYRV